MGRLFAVKKVRKQMYPATYNFMDEADGTSGTDIDFVDIDGSGVNASVEIIAESFGHKKVLKLTAAAGGHNADVTNEFIGDDQTSGTIEWWHKTDNAANSSQLRFIDGGNTGPLIAITGDKWKYYDGAFHDIGLAALDNTWYHLKFEFECSAGGFKGLAADTFYIWINNVRYGAFPFWHGIIQIDRITLLVDTNADYSVYIDAFGYSWDTDYNIGDNCFWRHYKESTDSFEGDDVGTQGTAITWVDAVDTAASVEIVAEFNEHKKILRSEYGSAVGGMDYYYHTFATQSKNGWWAGWIKTSDVTTITLYRLREGTTDVVDFRFNASKIQYWDDNLGSFEDALDPVVNDTWYFIYVRWYDAATDIYDFWINNVLIVSSIQCSNNQTSGVNRFQVYKYTAASYAYLDAPISSLDSDSRGDNRIFDYNDAYTREDITTDVINVNYGNALHQWRTGTLFSKVVYYNAEVFFQIYDVNSKLSMEADLTNRIQNGAVYTYPLLDKNLDDLLKESNNTFSAAKIHDPTDSTSMLKVILPNVSEADGDLLLVDADTKTDTYSPVTKNYLDLDALRDISDLADSVVIVQADGKCYLDDDKASGDSLDLDVAADKLMMTKEPVPNDIVGVNYWEVFGAMNPDTGTRFYKIVDSSGNDKKRRWRITNNSFRTQTDVDAYAAKLSTRVVSVKEITIFVQGLGTHNMGELFNYKYVNSVVNIPQADYYVISETVNMDTAEATIVLSEGLVELSKYASAFEKPQNYSDADMSEIYETDYITIELEKYPLWSADLHEGQIRLDADGEGVGFTTYLDDKIDPGKTVILTCVWYRVDNNNDTLDIHEGIFSYMTDGTLDTSTILNAQTTWDACPTDKWEKQQITITSGIEAGKLLKGYFQMKEAGREIKIETISIRYHIKREL